MLTVSIVRRLNLYLLYLNFRKQKTKVGSTFSDYLNILFGIFQGSIVEPIFFFSMFTLAICFSKLIILSSPAMQMTQNTSFASEQNHEKLVNSLQSTLNGMFEWHLENYFKTMQINGAIL